MERNKSKNTDSAVSPVVGVLLMLVVTIIIAAVVSGFAGGLASDQSKPPVASLDVQINALANAGAMPPFGNGYYCPTLVIKHMGGDPIATKNTKVVTFFKNASDGEVYQGVIDGIVAVPGDAAWTEYLDTQYIAPLFINDATRFPAVVDNYTTGTAAWFGNESAVLRVGDVLTASQGYCGNYNDNTGPDSPHDNVGLDALTGLKCSDPATGFIEGAVMTVEFIDIPSGKAIYKGEVTIQ